MDGSIASNEDGRFTLFPVTVLALRVRALFRYEPYRDGSKRPHSLSTPSFAQILRKDWWPDAFGIAVACLALIFVFSRA